MYKKIVFYLFILVSFFSLNYISEATFTEAPEVNCYWLPWCNDWDVAVPWKPGNVTNKHNWIKFLGNFISELIKYVSVIAVIAIMLSWIMYLVSGWEETKVKKAKNWIIWSLVWVFLSVSAWWIINLLNNIQITPTNF